MRVFRAPVPLMRRPQTVGFQIHCIGIANIIGTRTARAFRLGDGIPGPGPPGRGQRVLLRLHAVHLGRCRAGGVVLDRVFQVVRHRVHLDCGPRRTRTAMSLSNCGSRIRTGDLRGMSPPSCRCSIPPLDNRPCEPKEKGPVESWLHEALVSLASPRGSAGASRVLVVCSYSTTAISAHKTISGERGGLLHIWTNGVSCRVIRKPRLGGGPVFAFTWGHGGVSEVA
jgi:hypothetical protein